MMKEDNNISKPGKKALAARTTMDLLLWPRRSPRKWTGRLIDKQSERHDCTPAKQRRSADRLDEQGQTRVARHLLVWRIEWRKEAVDGSRKQLLLN